MPRVFHLDEVLAGPGVMWPDDSGTLVKVGADRASARRLWAFVLGMALADRGTSVHFHPWLRAEGLSYMQNGGLRCIVNPPPDELVGLLLDEARALLGAGPIGRWLGQGSAAGRFEVEYDGRRSDWAGTVWQAGDLRGVELYLVREPSLGSFWEDAAVYEAPEVKPR
jgi:hypothetical protein